VKDIFETLSPDEAKIIQGNASETGRRPYSPVTKALLDGNTVFLAGRQSYNTKTFTNKGKRLRSNRGERNGVAGVYIWLEDLPEVPKESKS
jgi:hypothetical protein